jgi:hypothetical protein
VTVTANPLDVPGVYGQGVGKGTQVLNAVAAQQAVANVAVGTFVVPAFAQLNLLQIEAVDYFMSSYWVSADSIITQFSPLPTNNRCGTYINGVLSQITARKTQIAQVPPQFSQALVFGNVNPQYSQYMPPYPLTPPDNYLYSLQTQLVDFLMVNGIVSAATILATMSGSQTYPFAYNTNGQFFSPYGEGDVDIIS